MGREPTEDPNADACTSVLGGLPLLKQHITMAGQGHGQLAVLAKKTSKSGKKGGSNKIHVMERNKENSRNQKDETSAHARHKHKQQHRQREQRRSFADPLSPLEISGATTAPLI